MANLIIDIGNSRAKAAVICGSKLCGEYVAVECSAAWLDEMLSLHSDVCQAIVSSTGVDTAWICEWLEARLDYVVAFSPATTPMPIGNDYLTPETLGADRIAAAVGAMQLYPSSDIMIVDFGTAITIDYVVDGSFKGGNISPGMTTRFRALSDYTARLPLCSVTDDVLAYGRTTREAIEQGVMQGITHEIEGYIAAFSQKKEKNYTIFTGGDAKYFAKRIKNAIFADCEPVIYGLNTILDYNATRR
ncbi:MAG: type III pantothenate kinase [Alistipes sp.]|nr:type III pantothenate kinase [Alistipes sp.]